MKEQSGRNIPLTNDEIDLEKVGDKVVGGMDLRDLDVVTGASSGRKGRGHGSGNGKTEGRGMEGQETSSCRRSSVLISGSREKDLPGTHYHIIRSTLDT